MSNKSTAKFYIIFILITALAGIFSACSDASLKDEKKKHISSYDLPKITGKIKSNDVEESSGIAASRCQSDVLWTHNDSDNGPYIYALRSTGENLGTWKVQNAESNDWEDIAAYKDKDGKCFIYIGDIGDNELQFGDHAVYRIAEPVIQASDSRSDRKSPLSTEAADAVRFKYPDMKQNAETLVVQPITGSIYVLTKRIAGPSGVYRIKPDFGNPETQKAQIIAEISVPSIPNGVLTGGDISPDGKGVIVCDYAQGYELTLPENASTFDEIWLQKPEVVDLGDRKQGEAVCYNADGSSVFATSEGKRSSVIEVKRR